MQKNVSSSELSKADYALALTRIQLTHKKIVNSYNFVVVDLLLL